MLNGSAHASPISLCSHCSPKASPSWHCLWLANSSDKKYISLNMQVNCSSHPGCVHRGCYQFLPSLSSVRQKESHVSATVGVCVLLKALPKRTLHVSVRDTLLLSHKAALKLMLSESSSRSSSGGVKSQYVHATTRTDWSQANTP